MDNSQKKNKSKLVIEFEIPLITMICILICCVSTVASICSVMVNAQKSAFSIALAILGAIAFYAVWYFLLVYIFNSKKCTLDDKTLTVETKIIGYHSVKKYRLDAIHKINGNSILGFNTIMITFEQGKLCTNINRKVRLRYVNNYDSVLNSLYNILTSVESDKENFYNLQSDKNESLESIAKALNNSNSQK